MKSALNFKSLANEKVKIFSQGTYNFQNLWNETLITADYEYVKISSFALLKTKLWLKEGDDLWTDDLWYSMKFI